MSFITVRIQRINEVLGVKNATIGGGIKDGLGSLMTKRLKLVLGILETKIKSILVVGGGILNARNY